jgi:hypothetical protein
VRQPLWLPLAVALLVAVLAFLATLAEFMDALFADKELFG